jgi:hypothetical protein
MVTGNNFHGKNVHIYGRKKGPEKKCPLKRKNVHILHDDFVI